MFGRLDGGKLVRFYRYTTPFIDQIEHKFNQCGQANISSKMLSHQIFSCNQRQKLPSKRTILPHHGALYVIRTRRTSSTAQNACERCTKSHWMQCTLEQRHIGCNTPVGISLPPPLHLSHSGKFNVKRAAPTAGQDAHYS